MIKLLSPTSGRKQAGSNFEGEQSSAGDSSGGDNKLTQSKPKEDDERLLTILDFQYDQTSNRFTRCPAAHELHRAHDREYEDQHLLLMLGSQLGACQKCSLSTRCPMRYDAMLKRVAGFGRLRVRGRPAVTMSTLLKVAGWNLLRAASVRSLVQKLAKHSNAASSGQLPWPILRRRVLQN